MRKIYALLLMMVCMLAFGGCGSNKVDAETIAKVYGTWVRTETDMTITYTLNSDGTYSQVLVATGEYGMTMNETGTYTFDGEKIVLTSTEFEMDYEYIVSFDGADMIWDSGSKQLRYVKQ